MPQQPQRQIIGVDEYLAKAQEMAKEQGGHLSITTECLGVERDSNYVVQWAAFKASAAISAPAPGINPNTYVVYNGHGDARYSELPKHLKDSVYRMAETRALSRALKWLTGLGGTAEEEISHAGNHEEPTARPAVSDTTLKRFYQMALDVRDWEKDKADARIKEIEQFGGRTPGELTEGEVNSLIKKLEQEKAAKPKGNPLLGAARVYIPRLKKAGAGFDDPDESWDESQLKEFIESAKQVLGE